ncbi:MAG: PAS domain-containing protein [bacterium]
MIWRKAAILLVSLFLALNASVLIGKHIGGVMFPSWLSSMTSIFGLFICCFLIISLLKRREWIPRAEILKKQADLTDFIVFVIGPDKKILYANEKASALVGISKDALLGKNWIDFIPPPYHDRYETILEGLINRCSPLSGYYEAPLMGKDGNEVLIAWHSTLVVGQNNKVVAAVWVGEDITEKRRIENRFKYILSALDSSPNCVLLTDKELKITYASQGAAKFFCGQSPEILRNRSVKELIDPEDLEGFLLDISKSLSQRSNGSRIYRMLTAEKRKIPCELAWSPITDSEGQWVGLVISARDASERLATALRLKIAARLGSDLIYEWDMDSDKITWYGEITKLLGCSVDQVPRDIKAWLGLIHPDDKPSVEEIFKRKRTSIDLISCEYRIMHSRGHWLHWVDKGQGIVEGGKIIRWIGVYRDVTSERKMEAALKRSEEKYRLVSENIPVAVYSTRGDPSEGCLFVSERVQEITGYSGSEFIIDPGLWSHIIHPEDKERVTSSVARKVKNKASISEEYRIITRSGRTVWVRYKAVPTLDRDGNIVRLDGFIEDISDRKLAEISLQKSEEELRIAHRMASSFLTKQDDEVFKDILSILRETPGGRWALLGWNDEEGSLVTYTVSDDGFKKEVMQQKPISSLNPPWCDAPLKVAAQRYEATLFAPDGKTMFRRAVIAPLVVKGKIFGIVGIAGRPEEYSERDCELLDRAVDNLAPLLYAGFERDMKEKERLRSEEERRRMEERMFEVQKMESLGQLAGGIAHEFNNLLATIRGYTELLLSKVSKSGSLAADLRQIKKASDRAADLTRQLLLFGRSHPMESRIIDPNALINGMYRMLTDLMGEKVKIETKLDPQAWRIKGDRRNIEQVIMNLVLNSRESMPDGGLISIETVNSIDEKASGDAREVCLIVRDNGKGMDEETLKHLFEPFYRSKGTKRRSGLGLAVVHGIVDQHHGRISVESDLGKGTTFKIFFPAVLEIDEASHLGEALQGKEDRVVQVLVIEDEEPVLLLMERVLSENGFEVTKASSCEEARRVFDEKKGEFDVLIVDMVLPDGNGVELAEELRQKGKQPGVILTSGYIDGSYNEIAGRGYVFLSKPFSVVELLQVGIRTARSKEKVQSEEMLQAEQSG